MIDIDAEKKRIQRNVQQLHFLAAMYVCLALVIGLALTAHLAVWKWQAALLDGAIILNLVTGSFLLRQAYRTNKNMRDSLFDIERSRARAGFVVAIPEIHADCGCGAKLIRKDSRTWVCPNEPWYTRWLPIKPRHACLEVALEAVPRDPGGPENEPARKPN